MRNQDPVTVGAMTSTRLGWILVAASVAAHLPFATMSLCGEEGNYGRAAVKVLERQRPVLVIARDLDGNEYTTIPGHNLGGYVLPALVAAPAIHAIGFTTDQQRARAAVALRLAFLILYGLALCLALAALPPDRRLVGGSLLALFSLFPLPLLSSLQVQYDGAVSTVLLVAAVAAIVRGVDAERTRVWLLAAGGFAISLGKLEYFVVAVATVALVAAWRRRPVALAAFVVGAVIGSALCWSLDRANFVGGYDVVRRFSGIQERIPLWTRVSTYVPLNARYLWPLYVALPLALIGFAVERERRRMIAPLAAAAMVCVGYATIAWRGEGFPRYFAPAFVLLPMALAMVRVPTRFALPAVLAALAPFAVPSWLAELHAGDYALCDRLGGHFDARAWATAHGGTQPCVPVLGMESGPGFYSRHVPFACCGAQWTTEFPTLARELCR